MAKANYKLDDSLGFLVSRAHRALGNSLTRNFQAAGYDITGEQWALLVRLWNQDGQNQQELSLSLGKDKTSVSRLIDNLEKSKLVVRKVGDHDRRDRIIHLTAAGERLQGNLIKIARKTLKEATRNIPPRQLQEGMELLRIVFANLSEP